MSNIEEQNSRWALIFQIASDRMKGREEKSLTNKSIFNMVDRE